ncbi:hypothetical protein K461DRAFT_286282 [Myriangium duriaei CBS 260.36]|uniref:Pre-mRNA-splicing factor cef1 n=1 Tax=Myriangium duriaei CBS 260.36 TaxID=1168546 RepID=A0A9P4MM16_9PEZI|nr:hypothetical protein K461DRAFT_286282 [Myriangium duriaei CBS 260.36]
MPVVKGGVWTNIEDEILKASVSKYGLNQWARVSSLLARKTPKQCKARWAEWLDPGIRKVEWSKEEDEKLLHLAKLMPTQWRTIAPIVGRTATQCLERYQKLLDEAEARENDDLGLGGPAGGESAAPSADDVRKLRPGELDPDPESKPARPDTIDLDEDEKEMLSEARARLANTQGKKAKRKARERQLEESKRLAVLQKRRELKASGINIKVTTRKKGEMDYNADIPFEKAPAAGFYDTKEEMDQNEIEREAFDPRKQQLANKRKGDNEVEDNSGKRQKKNKDSGSEAFAAAAKAGQLAKLRQAEQNSKRRGLVLPAPQVSDAEMDDIVKQGMLGERANQMSGDNESTRGLVGDYSTQISQTPIRTPRAPQEEDRIANEVRNARLRTETQSALLGGENADILSSGITGYTSATPARQSLATPNPLATPYRQANGVNATPGQRPGATPRDTFRLNSAEQDAQLSSLRKKLAALPAPRETEWELELPDAPAASVSSTTAAAEDSAVRDERARLVAAATARAELLRESRVVQRGLPRPKSLDYTALATRARQIPDQVRREVALGAAALMASDGATYGGRVKGAAPSVQKYDEEEVLGARVEVMQELNRVGEGERAEMGRAFEQAWEEARRGRMLPGLAGYEDDEDVEVQRLTERFDALQDALTRDATSGNSLELKLGKIHGGYIARANMLRGKIGEAGEFLARTRREVDTARTAGMVEEAGLRERLERLREEVAAAGRREREGQEMYRARREELDSLMA